MAKANAALTLQRLMAYKAITQTERDIIRIFWEHVPANESYVYSSRLILNSVHVFPEKHGHREPTLVEFSFINAESPDKKSKPSGVVDRDFTLYMLLWHGRAPNVKPEAKLYLSYMGMSVIDLEEIYFDDLTNMVRQRILDHLEQYCLLLTVNRLLHEKYPTEPATETE